MQVFHNRHHFLSTRSEHIQLPKNVAIWKKWKKGRSIEGTVQNAENSETEKYHPGLYSFLYTNGSPTLVLIRITRRFLKTDSHTSSQSF